MNAPRQRDGQAALNRRFCRTQRCFDEKQNHIPDSAGGLWAARYLLGGAAPAPAVRDRDDLSSKRAGRQRPGAERPFEHADQIQPELPDLPLLRPTDDRYGAVCLLPAAPAADEVR